MSLKPESDTHAQVIVHGHAIAQMGAGDYHDYKPQARDAVLASYRRLQAAYDTVIVEGAGSPAEINLREGDIANMGFAEAVDCPVVLIADIDRGGVFAHLVGTLALLRPSEQARVTGFVINRFRGDPGCCNLASTGLRATPAKPCSAFCRICPVCSWTPRTASGASRRLRQRMACCGWWCRYCRESATTPISIHYVRIRRSSVRYVDGNSVRRRPIW